MAPTTDRTADDATPESLSYDEIFSICGNQRRRYALEYLEARGGSMDLTSLAEIVAMEQTETPREQVSDADRRSVYNSLYQTHLPQMERAGVIDYDADAAVVALGDRFEEVEPYIGIQDRVAKPQSAHYFGLSLVSGALLALDTLRLVPSASDIPWPAIALLVFTVLSLVYALNAVEVPLRLPTGLRA